MALISALPLIWVTPASLTFSSLPLRGQYHCCPQRKYSEEMGRLHFPSNPSPNAQPKPTTLKQIVHRSLPEREDAKVVAPSDAHTSNDQRLG